MVLGKKAPKQLEAGGRSEKSIFKLHVASPSAIFIRFLSVASLLACFTGQLSFAQQKNLQVEDLNVDSSPEAVARAHAELKKGIAILRVRGGSQRDIERLLGVPLLGLTVKTTNGQGGMSKPGLLSTPSLQMTAAAAYKDEHGAIRSAVVFSSTISTTSTTIGEGSLKRLDAWIEQEQARGLGVAAEGDQPEPPAEAWVTQISREAPHRRCRRLSSSLPLNFRLTRSSHPPRTPRTWEKL